MTDRIAQIILLLRCRADYAYDGVRDSLASLKVKRGPAPSRRVECPDCGGEGMTRQRGIGFGCARCGGSGRALEFSADPSGDTIVSHGRGPDALQQRGRTHGLGRGWIEVDAYTERAVSTVEAPQPAPTRVVPCDACQPNGDVEGRHPNRRGSGVVPLRHGEGWTRCRICEGSGMVSVDAAFRPNGSGPAVERTGDPALDAAARRERYSFPELDRALTDLAFTKPGWRALVWTAYEQDREQSLTPLQRVALADALAFLERLMPAEIKLPGYARAAEERRLDQLKSVRGARPGEKAPSADRRAIAERDQRIRTLARYSHYRPQTLAEEFGLSVRQVYNVLGKANGDEVAA